MNKAIKTVILSLFVFALYAAPALARTTRVDGWEIYYNVTGDTATITGTGEEGSNSSNLIIPEELDGFRVTHIERDALRKTHLGVISLPDGIEHLEAQMPEELSSVKYPAKLKTIGDSVFKNTKLKQVKLPKTVTSIGRSAFESCENLTKAVLPEGLQFLGPDAFRDCKKLEEINIPDAVKWSVDDAFDGCRKIRKINYNGEMTANMREAFKYTVYMRGKDTETNDTIAAVDEYNDTADEYDAAKRLIAVHIEDGMPHVSINGYSVLFTDAQPFIDANSRTQVPLRRIASRMGCRVSYDDESREILLSKQGTDIRLRIGSSEIYCNDSVISMDTEAVILNDRTYIPLRYLAQALGYEVEYE